VYIGAFGTTVPDERGRIVGEQVSPQCGDRQLASRPHS
jgi:hypothetical protein